MILSAALGRGRPWATSCGDTGTPSFAINQECGMMCIYHGWKFDVNGDCVDMPSDLPGSTFKDKVHATSYPCIESAGVIWTYMGPADKKPP
jgi:phthalate 4,5-dioxygenase oxygenase subunit